MLAHLNSQQKAAVLAEKGIVRVVAAAGSGKCLGRDTQILMFDGSIKSVQDIQPNECLMGPDSKPRMVLTTSSGVGPLYIITPTKGDSWVCNDVHVLTVSNHRNELVDIPIQDYLIKSNSLSGRTPFEKSHKLFRASVEFEPSFPALDPYLIGLWLGDGSRGKPEITNNDIEVSNYLHRHAKLLKASTKSRKDPRTGAWSHRLSSKELFTGQGHTNPILDEFRRYVDSTGKYKCIPKEYLITCASNRLRLLAGLVDSDGYCGPSNHLEISTKFEYLKDDILFLCRSLGMAAYASLGEKSCIYKGGRKTALYWRISISGNLDKIPTLIPRKKFLPRKQVKNVQRVGFAATSIGMGEYYGFTLGGDGRFLLGDFTVTHNTSTLTTKIAYEISKGMNPKKVLALTFTKKAGEELRVRLRKLIGDKVDDLFAGTFHSFAHQHLCKVLDYTILNDNDVDDIVKGLLETYPIVRMESRELIGLMGYHRNRQKPYIDSNVQKLANEFKAFKLKNNFKDYDDLLEDFLLLLKKDFLKFDYELVLTDEGQDSSGVQIAIVKELIKTNRNLFLVGDQSQAIYGWRGADTEGFIDWEKEGCKDYPLAVNYRSTKEIIKVANRILFGMHSTKAAVEMIPIKEGECPKVKVVKVKNNLDEASYIVSKIMELRRQGHKYSSIAVLYRSHFLSNILQLKLTESHVPFSVWSGQQTLKSGHIQDVLCFMRAYTNPKDVLAWARVVKLLPGIGKVRGQKLAESIVNGGMEFEPGLTPIRNIFSQPTEQSFISSMQHWYLPILNQLHPDNPGKEVGVKNFCKMALAQSNLKKFVSDITLTTDRDDDGELENKVILTTIHSAKGLEFENVFVIGIYDGVFPSFRSDDPEEEKRLYYVAVTRAKTNLTLSFPSETGRGSPTKSLFLDMILPK